MMANVYVSAAGSSTTPFDTWVKAGSLTSALGVAVAGDDIWIASSHSEVASSAVTYTFPGTVASPNRCIVASTISGNAPPVNTDLSAAVSTASVASSTGGNINIGGNVYIRGLVFNAGSSTGGGAISPSANNINFQKYELCALNKVGSGAGNITFGNGNSELWLVNSTLSFGSTNDSINVRGRHIWQNGSLTGGTVPSTLFIASQPGFLIVEGVDLSAFTSGNLIRNESTNPFTAYFKDCKLAAGASVLPATSLTNGLAGSEAYAVRCDSGATTYRQEKHNYCADLIQNTSITRSGGATDGITPICWQITTTANSKWYNNFQSFPISMWNSTVGVPVTVVIHATSNLAAGAFPNNNDIWIEVEYLGSASSPQGSFANNTIANVLTTATAYTSDGATWANAPAGGTFAMSVTVTPQLAGPITVYVRCAKASTIFYVDPLISPS